MSKNKLSVPEYYWYSVSLGFRAALRGHYIPGLKRLLNPVSFWRCIEIPWVFNALQPQPIDRILDLGSPKLLSLYLVHRVSCTVLAVDVLSNFIREYSALLTVQGLGHLWNRRYFALQQNGRHLPYNDNCFDKAYSISVIEHIPDEGDMLAICEIARVLKPGGRVAITVPYSKRHREEWVHHDMYERTRIHQEAIFYQRAYDQSTLEERILKPSGLSLVQSAFYSGYDVWDRGYMYLPLPLRAALAPLQPLLARVIVKPIGQHEASANHYNLACLLLGK